MVARARAERSCVQRPGVVSVHRTVGERPCVWGNRFGWWRMWEEAERGRDGLLKKNWGANDLGGLTVDWIQQRQGKFDPECTCGWAGYTCSLLSVGSIENGAPRRIHMSGNNREGQVGWELGIFKNIACKYNYYRQRTYFVKDGCILQHFQQ